MQRVSLSRLTAHIKSDKKVARVHAKECCARPRARWAPDRNGKDVEYGHRSHRIAFLRGMVEWFRAIIGKPRRNPSLLHSQTFKWQVSMWKCYFLSLFLSFSSVHDGGSSQQQKKRRKPCSKNQAFNIQACSLTHSLFFYFCNERWERERQNKRPFAREKSAS